MVAAVPGEVEGSLRGQEHDTKVQVLHPAHSKRGMGGDVAQKSK